MSLVLALHTLARPEDEFGPGERRRVAPANQSRIVDRGHAARKRVASRRLWGARRVRPSRGTVGAALHRPSVTVTSVITEIPSAHRFDAAAGAAEKVAARRFPVLIELGDRAFD